MNYTEHEIGVLNRTNWTYRDTKYDFMKKILTASVTIFGIVVAFSAYPTSKADISSIAAIFLAVGYGGLALGIVCISVALYGVVVALERMRDNVHNRIETHCGLSCVVREDTSAEAKEPVICEVCEIVAYVSLLLSVIGFALFLIIGTM